jgi:plastocyanin
MSVSRSVRTALVLAMFAAATAWSPPQPAATVTIRLTGTGVVVTPQRVTLHPGDELEWESEHSFAVAVERNRALFGRELPPGALRARAQSQGKGPSRAAVRARMGGNAPEGTYKYSVGVWDGENVWVLDPEIVITPRR